MSLVNNYCKHGYENAIGCKPCNLHEFQLSRGLAACPIYEYKGVEYVTLKEHQKQISMYWCQISVLEEELRKASL